MSGRTLVLLALFGALLGGVWYQFTKWKPSKPVQPQVLIAYAPFMNETKTAKAILKKLLATPQRVIDTLCSEGTGQCFNVIDRYELASERLLAFRGLRHMGEGSVLLLSEARIIPPYPMTWSNFNSKTWRLHKETVRLTYARMMIAGSFFSGALDYNSTEVQNILILGLGGGIINNYYTTMRHLKLNVTTIDNDPVMKIIAEKWYEFEKSPMQRIIVDDGLRYIRQAVKRGESYDVLLIDVSYNDHRPLMAPVEDFLASDEIEQMKAIIKEDGAVIVNIVTRRDTMDEADRVHFAYSRHFPSCYFMQFGKYDKMLFCSKKQKNSWLDNRDDLYHRFQAIDEKLGFMLFREMQRTSSTG
uniref:Methyltransferase-like protein n=1 Tax=Haemonchus contortus TaxID=6289 RepID=A0A7I4Z1B8_HAECO